MSHPANFQFEHPRGPIYGWFTNTGLYRLELPMAGAPVERRSLLHSSVNDGRGRALNKALERYFAGMNEPFADIAIDIADGTPFNQRVWETAREFTWGKTATYGALTERLGKDKGAARAVGHALGSNRIAIIVPCHRFIGANGSLRGFAAGLEWKMELLRLEGSLLS